MSRMSDSGSDGDEWFDDEECVDEITEHVTCIFCDKMLSNVDEVWNHCQNEHDFNIADIKNKFNLDCFGYIKFINFQRKLKLSADDIKAHHADGGSLPWASDTFMMPEIEDDPLLQYDIEQVQDELSCSNEESQITISSKLYDDLLHRLKVADDKVAEAEERMKNATEDLNKLRSLAQDFVFSSKTSGDETFNKGSENGGQIKNLHPDEDQAYFSSYSGYGIHSEMLQDKVRTESYRDAIYKNADMFRDKVVLDVGCGTGILSMFAAKSGAKKVIGIDMSDIIYQAMDIVRMNKLDDKITLLKGKVEDIELPVEQVDIIISEWMGYFLLFESMLDTVIYARDRWLAPGGHILPNRCNISLVGISDKDLHHQRLGFWSDVYGFKMDCIRKEELKDTFVTVVKPDTVVTSVDVIKEVDICKTNIKDLDFTSSFSIKAEKPGELNMFLGYFDIWFDSLPNEVFFSTGPKSTATHWKQTVFLLDKPIQLSKDEELKGQIICRKDRKDPRALKIYITFNKQTYTYHMN